MHAWLHSYIQHLSKQFFNPSAHTSPVNGRLNSQSKKRITRIWPDIALDFTHKKADRQMDGLFDLRAHCLIHLHARVHCLGREISLLVTRVSFERFNDLQFQLHLRRFFFVFHKMQSKKVQARTK